jgi:hypothetical protein
MFLAFERQDECRNNAFESPENPKGSVACVKGTKATKGIDIRTNEYYIPKHECIEGY